MPISRPTPCVLVRGFTTATFHPLQALAVCISTTPCMQTFTRRMFTESSSKMAAHRHMTAHEQSQGKAQILIADSCRCYQDPAAKAYGNWGPLDLGKKWYRTHSWGSDYGLENSTPGSLHHPHSSTQPRSRSTPWYVSCF